MIRISSLMLLLVCPMLYAGNGILELDSKPGGAEVFVDGKKKGTTPETEGQKLTMELPEGDHEIEVKKEGAGSVKKSVFIGEGVIQPLTLSLQQEVFMNSLGMKFVKIPKLCSIEHNVFVSIYETRVTDFRKFVKETGHDATWFRDNQDSIKSKLKDSDLWSSGINTVTETVPVVNVSWSDSMKFCEWLTVKERKNDLQNQQPRYRLLSDHEWSVLVGLGSIENPDESIGIKNCIASGYPWPSGEYPPTVKDGNYSMSESNDKSTLPFDGFDRQAPVGSFRPNELGIYDLGGNVWEWVSDVYTERSVPAPKYFIDEKSNDPKSWVRFARGGGYSECCSPFALKSSCRYKLGRLDRYTHVGFRVAVECNLPLK